MNNEWNDLRCTYIFMYADGDARYIFNRSVDIGKQIGTTYINFIDAICGNEEYRDSVYESLRNMSDDFKNDFSLYGWKGKFSLIDTLPFKNIELEDQAEINKVKRMLCKQYSAVDKINLFAGELECLDNYIIKEYKAKIKRWYNDIVEAGNRIRNTEKAAYIDIKNDIERINEEHKERVKHCQKAIENKEMFYMKNIITPKYRDDMRQKSFLYLDYAIENVDNDKLLLLLDKINKKINRHNNYGD